MALVTTHCTTCSRQVYVSDKDAFNCPVCSSPLGPPASSAEDPPPATYRTPSSPPRYRQRLDEEMRLLGPRDLKRDRGSERRLPTRRVAAGLTSTRDGADQGSRTSSTAATRTGADFSLFIEHSQGSCTIRCSGHCDESSSNKLVDAVAMSLAGDPERILLDLRNVNMIHAPRLVLRRIAELGGSRDVALDLLPGEAIRRSLNRDGWDELLDGGIKVLDSLRFDVSISYKD